MVVGGDDAESRSGSDEARLWPVLAPPPAAPVVRLASPSSFSVVIAAYQAADTIGDAIESVRAQTVPPVETIVCDDGSTDDIEAALDPYRADIVFLRQENNGEASAKNAGVRAATGDFVVFLDADDVFLPRRLEALNWLATTRPDLGLLTTDAYLELSGNPIRRCYEQGFTFAADDQRSAILNRNFIFGLAAVRRDHLLASGGFDTSLRYATDWDLWCRLILDGVRAGLVDAPLARYRLHAQSLSAQRALLLRGRCAVLEKTKRRDDLSLAESETLRRALDREQREALLAELREALVRRAPDARRLALQVVWSVGVPPLTRLRAVVAAAAPRLARRAIRRRERAEGVPGQASIRFPARE